MAKLPAQRLTNPRARVAFCHEAGKVNKQILTNIAETTARRRRLMQVELHPVALQKGLIIIYIVGLTGADLATISAIAGAPPIYSCNTKLVNRSGPGSYLCDNWGLLAHSLQNTLKFSLKKKTQRDD